MSKFKGNPGGGVAFDKHGNPIPVGGFVKRADGTKFKVHGFTATYQPGTYANYAHDLEVTDGEGWVDSAPRKRSSDEETIIWGS